MMKAFPRIALVLVLLLASNVAFAHGGRTNSEGCHTDHSTGEYHCHNDEEEPVEEARIEARTEARDEARSSARGFYDCSSNVYNCSDFSFHQDAQNAYEVCLIEAGRDIHDLDRDDDGVACESLAD